MSKPQLTDSEKIVAIQKILEKHECWSDEQMAQSDYHSINGVDIIIDICKVVGYAKRPHDEEDED
jgi:hypothetical protein